MILENECTASDRAAAEKEIARQHKVAQATHEEHLKRQKLGIGGNRESSLRSFKLTKVWFTLDVNDS